MTKQKSKTKSKLSSGSGTKAEDSKNKDTSNITTTKDSTPNSTNSTSSKVTRNANNNTNDNNDKSNSKSNNNVSEVLPPIDYIGYESEHQLQGMVSLIENDLSEPYSIYTYRYFLHQWPKLSFLAMDRDKDKCIGVIVCRLEPHGHANVNRGYIAMLAVSKEYRKRRIGSTLVLMAIEAMKTAGADEIVLETEYTNQSAIALYLQMGFIKDKRLYRYYLNGVDAFRLKLFCKPELDLATPTTDNRMIV
ncbi:N-alpha-acetyltransferase 30A [Haplosporangium sp. Z 27]|nr:N-alpha-acetyltransferase 30A [Haplosporangium sp. Z 27]